MQCCSYAGLTCHSHMAVLCKNKENLMAGKMPSQSYKVQKNCNWHRLSPWDFKPSMYLSKANITFGIDKKIHPSKYCNVTTAAFMAIFNKNTNIHWHSSCYNCRVWMKHFKQLDNSPSSRCAVLALSIHFPALASHLPSVFVLFGNNNKKKTGPQAGCTLMLGKYLTMSCSFFIDSNNVINFEASNI